MLDKFNTLLSQLHELENEAEDLHCKMFELEAKEVRFLYKRDEQTSSEELWEEIRKRKTLCDGCAEKISKRLREYLCILESLNLAAESEKCDKDLQEVCTHLMHALQVCVPILTEYKNSQQILQYEIDHEQHSSVLGTMLKLMEQVKHFIGEIFSSHNEHIN